MNSIFILSEIQYIELTFNTFMSFFNFIFSSLLIVLITSAVNGVQRIGALYLLDKNVMSALALISGESLLRYLDAAFPALMIAQMVARVGCTFYGCCYGRETESSLHLHYTHPALKAVRQGRVNAGRLMPAQLLSAVNGGLIALVVFGLWLARPLPLGVPAALAATLYGLCRMGEEWVRSHDSLLLGPVSHAQVVALLLALVGLAFLLFAPADHAALYNMPGRPLDAVRVLQQLHPALLAAAGLLTAALFSYHYRAVGRWR